MRLSYGMLVEYFKLIISYCPFDLTSIICIAGFSFMFVIAYAQEIVGTSGSLLASLLHPEYFS